MKCQHLDMTSQFVVEGPPDNPSVDMVYWCPDCGYYFDINGEPLKDKPQQDYSNVPF